MNTQSKIYITVLILALIGLGWFYVIPTYTEMKKVDSDKGSVENQTPENTTNDANNSKDIVLENTVTPAYIVSIEGNKITLDYFEALSGEAAKKAVVEDGKCTQQQVDENNGCFPNGDIYDRNKNPKLRTFEFSPDITITTATAFSSVPNGIKNISVDELKRDYIQEVDGKTISPPYTVTIKNGVVTKIVEMFRP